MKLEEAIKSTKFKSSGHKALLNVMYTAYWLKSSFTAELKEFDITLEQFNVLRILRGSHPEQLCVKDIGSRIIEKSSNVPRILDRLVLKKLARRTTSKEDKRETLISITEKGLELLAQATAKVDAVRERMLGITEEDAAALSELLEKMREGVQDVA